MTRANGSVHEILHSRGASKRAVVAERLEAGETALEIIEATGFDRRLVHQYATAWRKERGLTRPSTHMRGTLVERLWAKVDKNGPVPEASPELGPCHVWTGCTYREGYGFVHDNRGELGAPRRYRTHRLAWALAHGQIADDVLVLHECDNPRCCNVAHLRLGTQFDNMHDAIKRGRHYVVRTTGKKRGEVEPLPDACTDRKRKRKKVAA